jgi:hypothetical protein
MKLQYITIQKKQKKKGLNTASGQRSPSTGEEYHI